MGSEDVFAIVAFSLFAVIVVVVLYMKEAGLKDPTNTRFIYASQMLTNHQLRQGPVAAVLIRQSGNEYRDLGVFPDASSALSAVEASFRKAGIDSVSVTHNNSDRFEVVRLHHNHQGRSEGKKLGGAVLRPTGDILKPVGDVSLPGNSPLDFNDIKRFLRKDILPGDGGGTQNPADSTPPKNTPRS